MRCDYNFDEEVWGYISEDAKSFISQLIEMDPEVRLTPRKASQHAWLQNQNKVSILDREYTESLHKSAKFESESSLLKKIALLIIARNASNTEINKLRLAFQDFDRNNSGVITFDDFKATLKDFEYTDEEINLYFDKLVSVLRCEK